VSAKQRKSPEFGGELVEFPDFEFYDFQIDDDDLLQQNSNKRIHKYSNGFSQMLHIADIILVQKCDNFD
jgi:hypothetical protein